MNNKLMKPLGILVLVLITSACIDSYHPNLKEFQSLLVVDALLTDEDNTNYVRLSRTFEDVEGDAEMVTNAFVSVKDDLGNVEALTEESPGVYRTNKDLFKGTVGRSYVLYIRTEDGKEYESDQCLLQEAVDIDSLYFERSHEVNDEGVDLDGVRAYVNTGDLANGGFYRWTYKEYWKFNVQYPKLYNYINDTTFEKVQTIKKTCWKSNKSDEILIQSVDPASNSVIEKKPVLFIPLNLTDRLIIQYCIEVRQYSMSSEQYEFWKQMKQINESGGDIFDKPPYSINSNIHCLSNPEEQVLGYFQVSGCKYRRCYITGDDVEAMGMDLPFFNCELVVLGPGDPQPIRISEPVTFDKIYRMYSWLNYTFIEPRYNFAGQLERLAFTTRKCADCTLTGSIDKPSFWVDIE